MASTTPRTDSIIADTVKCYRHRIEVYFDDNDKDLETLEKLGIDWRSIAQAAQTFKTQADALQAAADRQVDQAIAIHDTARNTASRLKDRHGITDTVRYFAPVKTFFLTFTFVAVETTVNALRLYDAGLSDLPTTLGVSLVPAFINVIGGGLIALLIRKMSRMNSGPIAQVSATLAAGTLTVSLCILNIGFGDFASVVAKQTGASFDAFKLIDLTRPLIHEPTFQAWSVIGIGLAIAAFTTWHFLSMLDRCLEWGRNVRLAEKAQAFIEATYMTTFTRAEEIAKEHDATITAHTKAGDETVAMARTLIRRIAERYARVMTDLTSLRATAVAALKEAAWEDYLSTPPSQRPATPPGDDVVQKLDAVLPKVDAPADLSGLLDELQTANGELQEDADDQRKQINEFLNNLSSKKTPEVTIHENVLSNDDEPVTQPVPCEADGHLRRSS